MGKTEIKIYAEDIQKAARVSIEAKRILKEAIPEAFKKDGPVVLGGVYRINTYSDKEYYKLIKHKNQWCLDTLQGDNTWAGWADNPIDAFDGAWDDARFIGMAEDVIKIEDENDLLI